MPKTVINVENLGKRYRIGHAENEHETLAGRLFDMFTAPIRNFRNLKKLSSFSENGQEESDIIWALKDINFQVEEGEVLGIIGKNGAGKSTLLKVLSQITEPTTGRAVIEGRVSSLLEVGTGFHKELTGRENVYLNGTILGMTKKEIDSKFDEIVEFAGVEKFIDTPVKRYSSGMKVRLGFAVAAHLEPDVMIIDEVLAVGDVEFQNKCLKKMKDLASSGRTVLFVSHQMNAVKNLCTRTILLKDGTVFTNGETQRMINEYLKICRKDVSTAISDRDDRKGNGNLVFEDVRLESRLGHSISNLMVGERQNLVIEIKKNIENAVEDYSMDIGIDNEYGDRVAFLSTDLVLEDNPTIRDQSTLFKFSFGKVALPPGRYYLTLFMKHKDEISDWITNAYYFDVEPGDYYKTGKFSSAKEGLVMLDYQVEIEEPLHVA